MAPPGKGPTFQVVLRHSEDRGSLGCPDASSLQPWSVPIIGAEIENVAVPNPHATHALARVARTRRPSLG
jgi:hypothetical protein